MILKIVPSHFIFKKEELNTRCGNEHLETWFKTINSNTSVFILRNKIISAPTSFYYIIRNIYMKEISVVTLILFISFCFM